MPNKNCVYVHNDTVGLEQMYSRYTADLVSCCLLRCRLSGFVLSLHAVISISNLRNTVQNVGTLGDLAPGLIMWAPANFLFLGFRLG